jgi:hypothetical protein
MIKNCVIAGAGFSGWYTYIRHGKWPKYYHWLKENRFDGRTSAEIFEEGGVKINTCCNAGTVPTSAHQPTLDIEMSLL